MRYWNGTVYKRRKKKEEALFWFPQRDALAFSPFLCLFQWLPNTIRCVDAHSQSCCPNRQPICQAARRTAVASACRTAPGLWPLNLDEQFGWVFITSPRVQWMQGQGEEPARSTYLSLRRSVSPTWRYAGVTWDTRKCTSLITMRCGCTFLLRRQLQQNQGDSSSSMKASSILQGVFLSFVFSLFCSLLKKIVQRWDEKHFELLLICVFSLK